MSTPHEDQTPVVHPLIYHLVVGGFMLPVALKGMSLQVKGLEHVPPKGSPLVVAANHLSAIDPFLVAKALAPSERHIQFMAKKELFLPVIGWFIRQGGTFPVNREGNDVAAMRTALRILAQNGTVGIFPQGQRGGEEMRGGVALIAAKGRAPILPVGISRVHKKWVIHFGEPIVAKSIKATTEELGRVLHELQSS